MNITIKEILNQAFSVVNNDIIWQNQTSRTDIIPLESELPLRFKLNEQGSRNVELMSMSNFGASYKTIALIDGKDIILPKEFYDESSNVNIRWFNKKQFENEINITIGAFSLTSLLYAKNGRDADYTANNIEYEMIKAFDGTMQNFVKSEDENPFSISSMNIFGNTRKNGLEGSPLGSFDFTNGNSGVSPTNATHNWLQKLIPQRLIEVFNVEQMP